MSVRDVRRVLEDKDGTTEPLADGEVQLIVRAGRAQVTITAGNNQITIKTDKTLLTDKVQATDRGHVFHAENEVLGSAVMVLSQINEA